MRERCIIAVLLVVVASGRTQDLEPRAYSASPVGVNFVVIAYGYSSGSVLFDPTLPLSNVKASLNIPNFGYGRTFGLFGRQALVTAVLPYVWGNISGQVFEQSRSIQRSGLADIRVKLSTNLRGNPARTPAEFARLRKRPLIVGTSITVSAPSGQYAPAKLVNIGTNRWAFKPEVGVSWPVMKRLYLDLYAGISLFTHNTDFFPGNKLRQQGPVTSVQGHVSYTFRSRLWAAADMTWYRGGAVSVDHGTPTGEQNNSRAGMTLSLPLTAQQSLKLAYSTGTTARIGSNFRSVTVAWQYSWLDSGLQ